MRIRSSILFLLLIYSLCLSAQGSWHPELEHWPRTVLETEDLQTVRDRILENPYSNFYNNVLNESEIDYNNCTRERDKAETCRSAAFRYLIDSDQAYGSKALEYLIIAQRENSDGYEEIYNNIIWDAENLTSICTAYDFLKGNNFDFEDDEQTVRTNIKDIASSLYYDIMENYLIHIGWEAAGKKTNYGVKLASALGIAAVVLNTETSSETEEQPLTWINYCMELLYDIFNQYLVDGDGGWAEGAHYQSYVAYNLLPFLFAHNNFLNGATEDYDGLELPPWLADQNFQNTLNWGIRIRMPNGARPNFDDSFNNPYYYNGIFADHYESDLLFWDYVNSAYSYYSNTNPGNLDIELICNFNNDLTGVSEPDFLTQFLPDAGQAIFRSSWEEDAVYMCLLGENSTARTGGLSHEHPDNMSFIIHAYGELLAMDSGYISFDQHDLVRYAKNHSLILVDGEGPSAASLAASGGTDAFIQDYFDLPGLDYAEVITSYQETDFARGVSFIDNSFFILTDIINGNGIRTYDWLLHGNSGGDTGNSFLLTENGAVYNVNGIELNLFFTTDHSISLSSYDDYHEAAYDTAGEHTVAKGSILAENAVISAFLIPVPENTEINYTAFDIENCAGGILEMDNRSTVTFVKDNNYQIEFELGQIPVSTNAKVTNIQKTESEIPAIVQLIDGTSLIYNEVNLLEASEITDVSLNIFDGSAEGYVRSACQLNLFTGNMPTTVDGALSYTYDAGLLTLDLAEDTYFHLDVIWSLVNTGSGDDIIVETTRLFANYPNPFNPVTVISFQMSGISDQVDVKLEIYNIKGQKVKEFNLNCHPELIEGSVHGNIASSPSPFDFAQDDKLRMTQAGSRYSITWDGTDEYDDPVPSGIYFYRLKNDSFSQTKKMLLLK
jgi:heparinase II/III-like protein